MNKDHFALYALDCDNVAHKDLALRRTVAKIERLNAENERLREALEGVIRIADRDCPEFRAARAALKQSEPKP